MTGVNGVCENVYRFKGSFERLGESISRVMAVRANKEVKVDFDVGFRIVEGI